MPLYTEDQIEREVERATDRYDARLMSGRFTQAEYDAAMRDLAAWAEKQYRNAFPRRA